MDDNKQGSQCVYCGGRLVSHFVHNAVGGVLDGLHCENCGLRYAFAPKEDWDSWIPDNSTAYSPSSSAGV